MPRNDQQTHTSLHWHKELSLKLLCCNKQSLLKDKQESLDQHFTNAALNKFLRQPVFGWSSELNLHAAFLELFYHRLKNWFIAKLKCAVKCYWSCKSVKGCKSVRGMGEHSVFVKRRSYCTLSSLGTLAPNMCLFYLQLCLLKFPLGLSLWQWSLLLEAVSKLLIPRERSHFLLSYFQAVWKEKSIVCGDPVSACCRTHKLLMSLSSLSSDNFSEHADRETLFKDVQSSRKVSVPILMISYCFLISSLTFLETEQAAKCKGLTPFLCLNPFPSLTSCAAWLLTLLYSLFCL